MNRSLGKCDSCVREAIVVVNGHKGCADHLEVSMEGAFAQSKELVKMLAHVPWDGPLRILCKNCWSQPGSPCTQPTDTGRIVVRWFHSVRESEAYDG